MSAQLARLLSKLGAQRCRPIIVASHPRSGTHLCIDTLRLNFRECRSWKRPFERADHLYVNLDELYTEDTDRCLRAVGIAGRVPRPLVKTHALPGLAPGYWGKTRSLLHPDIVRFVQEHGAIVYPYRDGRESLRSLYYMVEWRPSGSFASFSQFIRQRQNGMSRARIWAEHVRIWLATPNVHCLEMSQLLARPQEVIAQLARHLGLANEGAQLPPRCGTEMVHRLRRRLSVVPKSTAVELPPHPGKWTDVFSAADREFFHREAGDLLIQLGFEKSDAWVGRTLDLAPIPAPSLPISQAIAAKANFRQPDAIAS